MAHGSPWWYMRGSSWCCIRGSSLWRIMVVHCSSCWCIGHHVGAWFITVVQCSSWWCIGYHGAWLTMVVHAWLIMVLHTWLIMVAHHGGALLIMVDIGHHVGAWLITVVHGSSWWCIGYHGGAWLIMVVHAWLIMVVHAWLIMVLHTWLIMVAHHGGALCSSWWCIGHHVGAWLIDVGIKTVIYGDARPINANLQSRLYYTTDWLWNAFIMMMTTLTTTMMMMMTLTKSVCIEQQFVAAYTALHAFSGGICSSTHSADFCKDEQLSFCRSWPVTYAKLKVRSIINVIPIARYRAPAILNFVFCTQHSILNETRENSGQIFVCTDLKMSKQCTFR